MTPVSIRLPNPQVLQYSKALIGASSPQDMLSQVEYLKPRLTPVESAGVMFQLAVHCHQISQGEAVGSLSGFNHPQLAHEITLNEHDLYRDSLGLDYSIWAASNRLAPLAVKHLSGLNSEALYDLTWSFVVLSVVNCELIELMMEETLKRTAELEAHHLSSFAWACAQLRVTPPKLLTSLYREASKRWPQFTSQDLSILAWSCARQAIHHPGLNRALFAESMSRLSEFTPADLCLLAWASAKMYYRNAKFMSALSDALRQCMPHLKREELVTVAWAYGRLDVSHTQLMEDLSREAAKQFSTMSSQELVTISSAFAQLEFCKPELMYELGNACLQSLGQFKAKELAMLASSYGTLGIIYAPLSEGLTLLVDKRLSEFDLGELCQLACAYVELDVCEPKKLNALGAEALRKLASCNPQNCRDLAWAFAHLNLPQPELMTLLITGVNDGLYRLSPHQLGDVIWACAVIHVEALPVLFDHIELDQVCYTPRLQMQCRQALGALREVRPLTKQETDLLKSAKSVPSPTHSVTDFQKSILQSLTNFRLQALEILDYWITLPYCVDIALRGPGGKWAINLIDSSEPASRARYSYEEKSKGAQSLKQKLLQADGWHLSNIRQDDWDKLTSETQRIKFLEELLSKAGIVYALSCHGAPTSSIGRVQHWLYQRLPSALQPQTVTIEGAAGPSL